MREDLSLEDRYKMGNISWLWGHECRKHDDEITPGFLFSIRTSTKALSLNKMRLPLLTVSTLLASVIAQDNVSCQDVCEENYYNCCVQDLSPNTPACLFFKCCQKQVIQIGPNNLCPGQAQAACNQVSFYKESFETFVDTYGVIRTRHLVLRRGRALSCTGGTSLGEEQVCRCNVRSVTAYSFSSGARTGPSLLATTTTLRVARLRTYPSMGVIHMSTLY